MCYTMMNTETTCIYWVLGFIGNSGICIPEFQLKIAVHNTYLHGEEDGIISIFFRRWKEWLTDLVTKQILWNKLETADLHRKTMEKFTGFNSGEESGFLKNRSRGNGTRPANRDVKKPASTINYHLHANAVICWEIIVVSCNLMIRWLLNEEACATNNSTAISHTLHCKGFNNRLQSFGGGWEIKEIAKLLFQGFADFVKCFTCCSLAHPKLASNCFERSPMCQSIKTCTQFAICTRRWDVILFFRL